MKNSQRPAWMGTSRRAPQPAPKPQAPAAPLPAVTASAGPQPAKAANRGYNPYDTVNTRFPAADVWQGKPKRS